MIYIGSKNKLIERLKPEFQKQQERKPLSHADLEWVYTDLNQVKYYRFPDTMRLPLERFGKTKEYLMWIAAGITPSELDLLLDFADTALEEGIKSKGSKAAGKIGWVLQELRFRRKMILHTELLYNFLACQWIREDEEPTTFNNEIQLQKVSQFKEEVHGKDSFFFFQQKELKILQERLNLSHSEWIAYWEESQIQQQALREILKPYSSDLVYSMPQN